MQTGKLRRFTRTGWVLLGCMVAGMVAGCGQPMPETADADFPIVSGAPAPSQCENYSPDGMALFGDVHVHTSFSFDAAANSTGATPVDAHRYARGETIPFFPLNEAGEPVGRVSIDRPLDFLAVTDHGEFLGERALCHTPGSEIYATELCQHYRADERQALGMLSSVITMQTPRRIPDFCGEDGRRCLEAARQPWQAIQDAANEANTPCEFSSFIAYEYTGTPGTSNYHRNVIFRNSVVPDLPVSYIEAPIDSKLWSALDEVCSTEQGCDYITIPHNTNLANGGMAPYKQLEPTVENKRAYAEKRLQREPIMEIFQHKGASECINGLTSVLGSPDELCNVEAVRRMGGVRKYSARDENGELYPTQQVTRECGPDEKGSYGMVGAGCVHATDFQRSALVVGLAQEQEIGLNPIKLGVVAATDTHTATPGAVLENDWPGAVSGESSSAARLQPGFLTSGIDGNPGGLAGVWAKENTRDAIFDAMLRREVFGTSGPRIQPRFFAGWNLEDALCDDPDRATKAYAQGVPMGGDLEKSTAGGMPSFLAYAAKDPAGQNLAALHLIKGWVDAQGGLHTAVLPIAESAEGAASLCTVYTDQDFDPEQSAYYYLRVVEPPTPRWHTYDCARLAADERPPVCEQTHPDYPEEIREMAWTSPIWYRG